MGKIEGSTGRSRTPSPQKPGGALSRGELTDEPAAALHLAAPLLPHTVPTGVIPPPVLPGVACLGASARGKSFPGLQREPWSQRDCRGGQAEIPLPPCPTQDSASCFLAALPPPQQLNQNPRSSEQVPGTAWGGEEPPACSAQASLPQDTTAYQFISPPSPPSFFFGRHHTFTSSSGLPFQTAAEGEGKGGSPIFPALLLLSSSLGLSKKPSAAQPSAAPALSHPTACTCPLLSACP